jgi:hypothetical protein
VGAYDPTDEQKAIINSDDSALVVAGPGRGKTATVIAAAKSWLARNGASSCVLFTSFSNAAVKRVASAAGIDPAEFDRRVQFRTFHSLAMEVLRDFGRYVGIQKPVRALDRTEERIIAAERGWDVSDERTYYAALKTLAREEGRVVFELMVPLASVLLQVSPTIQRAVSGRFPFIVVDEFQDTRAEQWSFLRLLGEASRVVALGDPDQMIYERQHQATLRRMSEFERWKGVRQTQFDGPNFRCRISGILRFGEALLHGRRERLDDCDGIQLFSAYPNQRRASLAAIWSAIRRQAGAGSTIAFIVPSGNTARSLAAELRQPDPTAAVPVPIYAHIETDEGALDAFRLAACAAADWVATAEEGALRNLAISLAVFSAQWSRKSVNGARVAAIMKRLRPGARAKSPLRDYLEGATPDGFAAFSVGLLTALEADTEFASAGAALGRHGVPRMDALSLGQGSLFDDYRQMRSAAGLEGTTLSRARTTLVSMYRSKGREFDFVVLVVEPRAHSTKVSADELRRLYYVSATRARKWLGILHVPGRSGPVLGPVLGE